MMCFSGDRSFFKSYQYPGECLEDLSCVIADPCLSLLNLAKDLTVFFLCSLPLTIGLMSFSASPLLLLLSFNIPLLLLMMSYPVVMNLLMLNIPIVIAIALCSLPALNSLGHIVYDVVDMFLSPCVDVLRVLSNLGATVVENVEEMSFEF